MKGGGRAKGLFETLRGKKTSGNLAGGKPEVLATLLEKPAEYEPGKGFVYGKATPR